MRCWVRAISLSIVVGVGLTGCKDPENDMAAQPKYRTYEAAEMFPDGALARPLVAGTVRGRRRMSRGRRSTEGRWRRAGGV